MMFLLVLESFMDHLFKDFEQKGIHAFRDDKDLTLGKNISPNLDKVIQESRFLIVIFSKEYASSSWCLRELVKILECKETSEHKHEVRIIFYDVKPDMVRKQTGSYVEAFAKHEISNRTEVAKWKEALFMAANLSGWDLQDMANGFESKFIASISEEILKALSYVPLHVGENLVGVDTRVNEMNLLRFVGSDKVHMIGICGISGIGKTTLVKAVYNSMSIHFEKCSFCEDVQRVAKQQGLTQVQMQLIGKIMKTRGVEISSVGEGVMVLKQRMPTKPILVVLDDVDHRDQLEALAGSRDWFFPGSLIIFTSKDKQLLRSHKVEEIHDMEFLDDSESLKLFGLYAFREEHPIEDFEEVSLQVVQYVKGHPLALKVLGSFLCGKTVREWKSELERLEEYPNEEIHRVLRFSFDALSPDQKNIFLDIACSFIGENKDFAAAILDGCNYFADTNIRVLVDKSLITISRSKSLLEMHDLIQRMAREIVREESNMPGKRSRLWISPEVYDVLSENTGTEAVEVLELLQKDYRQKVHIDAKAFTHMKNLRILKICDEELKYDWHTFDLKLWKESKVTYFGRLKSVSNNLRLLYWHGCPFEFPSNFYPKNIVAIDLSYSHLKTLWTTPKCFGRLKVMKLRHCRNLTSTPDLTRITNLEELILEGCVNLVKVHPSIGMLKKLVVLNMRDCKCFRSFPCKGKMDSLEVLDLSGCTKLDKLPEFFCVNHTLQKLYIDGTAILELPSFVYPQPNLRVFEIGRRKEKRSRWWTSILQPSWLPSKRQRTQSLVIHSLAGLCSLKRLNLSHCNLLEVSDSIGGLSCLNSLDLSGNNFTSLPRCLSQLSHLEFLQLSGCKKLEVLLELPPNLRRLHAVDCTSLYQPPPNRKYSKPSFLSMWFDGCTELFRNVSIESQLCLSQPQPHLNSSITASHGCRNQISSFLQSMEFPNNTHGIFGGQEGKFFHQELSIIYHANIIPRWFTNTSTSNHIKVELPSIHCCNKLRGYAICVVFTLKYSHDREFFLGGLGYSIRSTHWCFHFGFGHCPNKIHKKDVVLFHFVATPKLVEEKNFVSFLIDGTHDFEVKECGVRLVFDEDIQGEDTGFSIPQDLPAPTEKEGNVDICRNDQGFRWSW